MTLLLLLACKSDSLDEIQVESATLQMQSPLHGMFSVVGVYSSGDAVLTVQEVGGSEWEIPVKLSGSLWGVGAGMGVDLIPDEELRLPDQPLSVGDLLGGYTGDHLSIMVGIGFADLDVRNQAGCEIHATAFDVGAGVEISGALLNLHTIGEAVLQ
jgi:hypothetical protein